jgi:hypothetical protein
MAQTHFPQFLHRQARQSRQACGVIRSRNRAVRTAFRRHAPTAAYFLGVISAGRYREISKPAATSHIFGLVQVFIVIPPLHRPEGRSLSFIQPLRAPMCNGSSITVKMD